MTVKRRFAPVHFKKVRIEGGFWGPRVRTNRERTIPHVYRMLKETGRADAFRRKPGDVDPPHVFFDSDVAKWMEAAGYSLAQQPDPELEAKLDDIIDSMEAAQEPDGYLNSHYVAAEREKRCTNLRDCHELYCAGHLMEAAAAHFEATGKRRFLDVIRRYADHIDTTFGPGRKLGYPGHPEIELALVKLFRVTGERRYLELSRFFLDQRGRQPHYYDEEARARGEDPAKFWARTYEYNQSHQPVREQEKLVGHAVRGLYLLSGAADLAGEFGDESLLPTCERLWRNLTEKRMYVTGGVGPGRHNEGFTEDYDLPNESAYAETCAAIALVFWAHRLLQFDCDGRYADVMERALYNGVLSGISLEGTRFFYVNPLASRGNHHRQEWFGCACCPTNIVRLLASIGGYMYSESETDAAVHLYVQGLARFELGGRKVTLRVETDYPWSGKVEVLVEPEAAGVFGLRLRVPGWARDVSLRVNGKSVDPSATMTKGYVRLEREWKRGDRVEIEFPMPVERMRAHPEVREDVGKAALQRGPVVYCLEQADNEAPVSRIVLPDTVELSAGFEPSLLGGVRVVHGLAMAIGDDGWDGVLYRRESPTLRPCEIKAIPFYAWDNREAGGMVVWVTGG